MAGFVAAPGAIGVLRDKLDRRLTFLPVPGLQGFRQLTAEAISTPAFDPFVGLAEAQTDPFLTKKVGANLNRYLFRDGQGLPVASFSDFYCPICRDFTELLFQLEASHDLAVTWHELPIFGEHSVMAARGAIAARAQSGYPAFHRRMMRTSVRAERTFVLDVARQIGLDVARFQADLDADATDKELWISRVLADIFGIYGTPSLIVGKTLVIGRLSEAKLTRLIQLEYEALSK
jgi:hypothetical protein